MFTSPAQFDIKNVKRFTNYVRKAKINQLTCVGLFYDSTIVHILSQKNLLSNKDSRYLSQLLVVLYQKIRQDPRVINQFPVIQKAISALLNVVDPQLFQEILNKLDSKELQDQQQNKQPLAVRHFEENEQIYQPNLKDNQNVNNQKGNKVDNLLVSKTDNRSTDCLGCYQYFYQKQSIDFVQKQQDVFVFSSAKMIRNRQQELKNNICNLLNNNGGFILFACRYDNKNLVAQGQSISEVKKQSILQQIIQTFSYFVPKLSFSNNAQLSFVPIARQSTQLSLIEGFFLTRLKIWSIQKQILYFYEHMGQLLTSYYQEQENQIDKTQFYVYKHRNILKQIKRKFKIQYMRNKIEEQGKLLNNINNFIRHKCKKPMVSKNLISTTVREIQNISILDLQKKYKYASIIFMQKISTSKVVNLLISQNISRFQFMPPGTEFSNEVKLLFHDTTPHKLKQIFEHNKTQKSLLRLLLLDNAIQLKNPLKQWHFIELSNFLGKILNFNSSLQYYQHEKEGLWFLYCYFKVEIYYAFNKLRQINFHGSKLVRLDTNAKNIQKVYSAS